MQLLPRSLRRYANFLLGLLALNLAGSAYAGTEAEDQQALTEMRTRIVELQKQMVGSSDPEAQLQLQKQYKLIMEATMVKLSPRNSLMVTVALQVMQPIQDESTAYIQMVADYQKSGLYNFTTMQTKADIASRIEGIGRLIDANQKLINAIDQIPTKATKMLEESAMSPAEKAGFRQGLTEGLARRMGPIKAIRNLDARIYALMLDILHQLDRDLGKWKSGEPITWSDPALEKEFTDRANELATLAERQTKAQETLINRM